MNRRWVWVLAGIGVVVLLAAGPVYWHVRARTALAKYRQELRAKGEKLTIQELVPLPPTNGYNGLARFILAAPQLTGIPYEILPGMMRHISPGHACVGWRQGTNDWAKLKSTLEQKEQAFVEVRASLEAPWFHDELNYEDRANLRFPNLVTMKNAAQSLAARAMLDFHEGKGKEGKTNLLAGLRLARLCCNEPILISQLVRIAFEAIAWSATWEALQYPDWQESELAELQQAWSALDDLKLMEKAVEMERAMCALVLQESRAGDAQMWSIFGGGGSSSIMDDLQEISEQQKGKSFLQAAVLRVFGKTFWKWWWSYEEELVDAQVFQAGLDTLRKVQREPAYFQPVKQLEAFCTNAFGTSQSKICFYLSQGSSGVCKKAFTSEARREMIIAAIALKRYYLSHRNYPARLAQLVPEFLPKAPIDWVDGQPLRYRLKDDQHFLLYSVGEDGKDDGGDITEPPQTRGWWHSKDWVYPEPATDAEAAEQQKAQEPKKKGKR